MSRRDVYAWINPADLMYEADYWESRAMMARSDLNQAHQRIDWLQAECQGLRSSYERLVKSMTDVNALQINPPLYILPKS